MTDLSREIAVKPIIKYPCEAQVGKTYLMTIDLQLEEKFKWQYDDEEYPLYCGISSDLFSSKSLGEPVIVLHRFGGTYGSVKFLLTAITEKEGEIKVALINRWGAPVRVIHLSHIKVKGLISEPEAMTDSSRDSRIAAIIEQRKPLTSKIEGIRENLSVLSSELQRIEERHHYLTQRFSNIKLKSLSLAPLQAQILLEIEALKKLRNRFSRNTLNIGIVGRARQGKSRLIQSLAGLSTQEIPDGSGQHCTGVRSTIYHQLNTEVYAEVWFHSERSFLDEVIAPYYQALQLGFPPKTIESFASNPLPNLSSSFNNAEFGAKYEYLRKYQNNIQSYKHLLDKTSPERIGKEAIREFVAQDTIDGDRSYFNYLAVKDVKIFCPFPNEEVGQVALVDMPGLGDTGIGDEERLLRTLSEDIDIVLFVRMPRSTGDHWADVDVRLYDIASAATSLPLALWSFMVLNRTQTSSSGGDNLNNCENLANTINQSHIKVVQCIIADCSNFEEVSQKILDPLLDYLTSNITKIDNQLVSVYADRLRQLQVELDLKLNDLKRVIENHPSEFALFEKLFNRYWKKLKFSFDRYLIDFETRSIKYAKIYSEESQKKIAEFRSNINISLNELMGELAHADSALNFHHGFLKQVRTQLLRKLSKLDNALTRLAEQMRNDVTTVFSQNEELFGLSDKEGLGSLEELVKLVPDESQSLRHGFQVLSNFSIPYSTLLQPQIREYLNKVISELVEKNLISNSEDVNKIRQVLMSDCEEMINGCEEVLANIAQVPPRLFRATVEEFIDNIIHSEDAQSEWRILLYENRYKVWDEFNQMREFVVLEQEWQQQIMSIEVISANIGRLP